MISWTAAGCLLCAGLSGHNSEIEAFHYAGAEAAQRAWRLAPADEIDAALRMVESGGRRVLEMPTPFASNRDIERVYIDRDVKLNLAAAGELTLEVLATPADAGARLSLYFRSGQGWYAAGANLAGSSWKMLRFSKASFSLEGSPAGWHQIDGVRIAVWRGQPRDGALLIRRLGTAQHDVALIIPSSADRNAREARQASEDVAEMLSEVGLGSDAVEDSALAQGGLGERKVAILAYNPDLSEEHAELLVDYVEQGGKLLVCYQLPDPLGPALGFQSPEYHRPEKSGTLAEVRFDENAITAMPRSMRQASWNITTAEPAGFHARVVGRWFSEDGQPTGLPALLVSDRGAFFSHIILRDDREKKKQMLAALLGHLAPPLWKQMAHSAVEEAGRVGHLQDYPSLVAFLRESSSSAAKELLQAAEQLREEALREQASGNFAKTVQLAGRLRGQLEKAYLIAQPDKPGEQRAFWNHSGTGAYDGDWERTARELSEAGFTMVMPNMLWGGRAHYPSDVLPRSRTFQEHGDQIAQCVAACKEHGIEVHVWKVNWNLSGAPRAFVEKIHRERRNQVSQDGTSHDWLCPSHPENFQLELDSMLEVARRYDVDGLHFDYIRYPDRDKCYCDGCRQRFESQLGSRVGEWPRDCYSGTLREEYAAWRCDQITRLVRAVHAEAKSLSADVDISAAVFGAYPSCKESVAQDWVKWVKAGYLDFVCPMDYTQDDQVFINLVSNQLELVDDRIPVYPGIGQWRLSDDRTVGQIFHARRLGAPGFTLFNLNAESIGTIVPALRLSHQ